MRKIPGSGIAKNAVFFTIEPFGFKMRALLRAGFFPVTGFPENRKFIQHHIQVL